MFTENSLNFLRMFVADHNWLSLVRLPRTNMFLCQSRINTYSAHAFVHWEYSLNFLYREWHCELVCEDLSGKVEQIDIWEGSGHVCLRRADDVDFQLLRPSPFERYAFSASMLWTTFFSVPIFFFELELEDGEVFGESPICFDFL